MRVRVSVHPEDEHYGETDDDGEQQGEHAARDAALRDGRARDIGGVYARCTRDICEM